MDCSSMRRVEAAFWADLARITTSLALVRGLAHPIRRVVAEVLQEVILADVPALRRVGACSQDPRNARRVAAPREFLSLRRTQPGGGSLGHFYCPAGRPAWIQVKNKALARAAVMLVSRVDSVNVAYLERSFCHDSVAFMVTRARLKSMALPVDSSRESHKPGVAENFTMLTQSPARRKAVPLGRSQP